MVQVDPIDTIDKQLYTIKELQEIMRISHNTAYKLVKLKGFPKIKIGKKILIPKNDLDEWLRENMNTEISL